jgi:ArsR family transcriptional regulator, lead/cadmium/zinc/bismuth-responsive transcriptional repressor
MKSLPRQKLGPVLRTAGDQTRLAILCWLFRKPDSCVSDVAQQLDQSIAAVSHHLRALARVGLLKPIRNGKRICYRLTDSPLTNDLRTFICKYK